MNNTKTTTLIDAAAIGDAQAIEYLCQQYRPVLVRLQRMYWLRLYDDDDWQQEARWICYLAAQQYDARYHLTFGRFYQMQLKHRIITLLRQQFALKRRCDQYAVRYRDLENIAAAHKRLQQTEVAATATLRADFAVYYAQLSQFERQVFDCTLHYRSNAEIAQHLTCSEKKVYAALCRCRLKMRLHMDLC